MLKPLITDDSQLERLRYAAEQVEEACRRVAEDDVHAQQSGLGSARKVPHQRVEQAFTAWRFLLGDIAMFTEAVSEGDLLDLNAKLGTKASGEPDDLPGRWVGAYRTFAAQRDALLKI